MDRLAHEHETMSRGTGRLMLLSQKLRARTSTGPKLQHCFAPDIFNA